MSEVIVEFLRALPLTRHCSDEVLQQLALHAQAHRLRHREQLVGPGDELLGMHLVREGAVLLEMSAAGGETHRIVHQCLPGDTFGEALLMEDVSVYPFSATATEPGTEVLLLPIAQLQELWKQQPDFPKLVAGALTQKVKVFYQRMSELLVASATTRLARYILERPRDTSGSSPEVDLGLDRRDLAALLAITPEHLSRILSRWTRAGLIHPTGRTIELPKLDLLAVIADMEEPPGG